MSCDPRAQIASAGLVAIVTLIAAGDMVDRLTKDHAAIVASDALPRHHWRMLHIYTCPGCAGMAEIAILLGRNMS